MVKIKHVWSNDIGFHVELDNGTVYCFRVAVDETKESIIARIKEIREIDYQRRKAREKKTIAPKLKHLKKLEGEEIE